MSKYLRKEITVGKLVEGGWNETERKAMKGTLCVQPYYQREFVYDQKDRKTKEDRKVGVVKSAFNRELRDAITIYNLDEEEQESFGYKKEVVDGQQRITSLCKFVAGEFAVTLEGYSVPVKYSDLLPKDRDAFLSCPIYVDYLEGTRMDVLNCFKIKNTVTAVIMEDIQLTLALFSYREFTQKVKKCLDLSNKYNVLETFNGYVKNASDEDFKLCKVVEMCLEGFAEYEGFKSIPELLQTVEPSESREFRYYLDDVFEWVEDNFKWLKGSYQGVNFCNYAKRNDWLKLYNKYHETFNGDVEELKKTFKMLIERDDLKKRSKMVEYLMCRDAYILQPRAFTRDEIERKAAEQGMLDAITHKPLVKPYHGDHIDPWSKGGHTDYSNLRVVNADTNLHKGTQMGTTIFD